MDSKDTNQKLTADEPRTLTAYRQLRQDIVAGRHLPGEKLRVEHLKNEYKVGAGTLREALALLVSDSLVIPSNQRGFRVSPMSLDDLEDLTRTRTMLECEALRDSIRAGDDEWEARVVSAYHTLSRAEKRLAQDPAGAFEEWEARNRAFHGALISGCKSRWILQFQSILYQQSERYRRMSATTAPSIPDSVHQEHRKLYEVAIARNETAAMALLADHVHFALIAIKNTGTLK